MIRLNYLKLVTLLLLAFFSLGSPSAATAKIPDVKVSIATNLKEDGKIGKEYNVLTLRCFNGECSLMTLVLNRCLTLGSGDEFQVPIVFRSSTTDGDLKVTSIGNTIIVEEETLGMFGDSNATYRFEFNPSQSTTKRLNQNQLINFSGAYIKQSDLAKKVITVEYVPLHGGFKRVEMSCPIELQGIPVLDE